MLKIYHAREAESPDSLAHITGRLFAATAKTLASDRMWLQQHGQVYASRLPTNDDEDSMPSYQTALGKMYQLMESKPPASSHREADHGGSSIRV